jgi:hypothetical protein
MILFVIANLSQTDFGDFGFNMATFAADVEIVDGYALPLGLPDAQLGPCWHIDGPARAASPTDPAHRLYAGANY